MMKKAVALAPAAEIVRRAVRLSLATFLAAVAVAVAAPDRADTAEIGFLAPDSDIGFADSDGYVPLYHDCLDNDMGALYVPYYDGSSIIGSILINDCAIERFGLGPNDLQRLIAHEMGHAQGLLHSDDPNDIMYPYLEVTGT
jgi:Matrixin